ncbi:hypothetical protein FGO68_gene4077 [Halteria grandinella]|uniref:Uncharacterized protein n=1 Tax=Halteria grandinella TaxID=5974 RepID=A0A8J8P896_HALGN|nr:hypothetical protein FGO68_gene4077 [Halteria grandinella]
MTQLVTTFTTYRFIETWREMGLLELVIHVKEALVKSHFKVAYMMDESQCRSVRFAKVLKVVETMQLLFFAFYGLQINNEFSSIMDSSSQNEQTLQTDKNVTAHWQQASSESKLVSSGSQPSDEAPPTMNTFESVLAYSNPLLFSLTND